MNRNLKKIWPALAMSLVLATSCINAADNTNMTQSKSNANAQQKGSMGMITPPVNPVVQGVDFSLGAEALYMRATEDSSAVGVLTPGSTAYPQTYTTAEQPYDWSWGARVNAGYAMPHDGWDLAAQWTWFHSSHTRDRLAPTGSSYLSTVEDPVLVTTLNNSDATALVESSGLNSTRRLYINMGDLDLGREFFISKWLTLRPCLGARGVWIERKLTVATSDITRYPTGLATHTSSVTTHSKGSYNAGGIYFGLNTQWGFGDGWSLFGVFDQSFVYGQNHVTIKEIDTAGTVKYTRAAGDDKWNTVRGITDLAIGLRWDYLFDNDNYRFRLQAAWEEHLFSNLDVSNFGSHGDLALTGASFSASFDF